MPPQKPVPQLYALAKERVMYNVCALILEEIFFTEDEEWDIFGPPRLSTRLALVKDILHHSLSPGIMEELLNTVLSKDTAVDATVRYLALQLLLVDGVRNLSLGNFPESYYKLVLEATAINGSGLYQLDLRGIWVRADHKFCLLKVLRKLNDVRKLTIRYVCDDDMLTTVGKYCFKLQKLDIAGSHTITEEGLRNLCENPSRSYDCHLFRTLQIVDLGGPGSQNLPPTLVYYLLLNLPHLVSLGSYEHTGQAVDMLYQKHPSREYKLKYIHDLFTSVGRHLALTKTCPDLQAVYLDSPKDTAVHHLDIHRNLSELKLHKVRWTDLHIVLQKMGARLRSLFLLTIFGQVDMIELGSLCPNLLRMEIHSVSLSCSDTTYNAIFHKVREMLIYSTQISTTCVKLIFNQCVNVEHLALGDCAMLTDPAVILSLRDNALRKIKNLWLGSAMNLTMRTVEALMDYCPELTSLGNLAAWQVHPDDLDLLRVQAVLTNTDITLHAYGPDEEPEHEWVPMQQL